MVRRCVRNQQHDDIIGQVVGSDASYQGNVCPVGRYDSERRIVGSVSVWVKRAKPKLAICTELANWYMLPKKASI